MSKKNSKKINCYTSIKRLYYEFEQISSSDESDFEFDKFNSGKLKEKKFPAPMFKRSKRQGMCLCSDDDSKSEISADETTTKEQTTTKTMPKRPTNTSNLIPIEGDKVLDDFIKNI